MAPAPDSSPRERAPLRTAIGAVLVFAVGRVLGSVLETASMAAIVAQAVAAEWGAGWLGLRWSEADDGAGKTTHRRIGLGLATGVIASAMVVGFLVSTRAITLQRSTVSMPTLIVGLVSAGLYAMRDELLLRGLPLLVVARLPGNVGKVLICGALAAAAALGEKDPSLPAVLVELVLGMGAASLWVRSGGAWWPWATHTAWLFSLALLLQGGLFEAHVAANAWGGGAAGPLSGLGAAVAVLPLGTAAIAWAALATGGMRRVR